MSDVVFSSFHTHLRDRSDVENAILEWEQMESSLPPPPDIPGLMLISEVLMPSMWKTRKPSPAEWEGCEAELRRAGNSGSLRGLSVLGLGPSANSHLFMLPCVFRCPTDLSLTHTFELGNLHRADTKSVSWLSLHACFLQKGARAPPHTASVYIISLILHKHKAALDNKIY